MDTATLFVAYQPGSANWPAIVQAIGSLVGIGIAIAVPWWNNRNASRIRGDERRRKGHAIAVLLQRDVKEWRTQFDANFSPFNVENETPARIAAVAQGITQSMALWVPSSIVEASRELEYLDVTGEKLLACMYNNQALKTNFDKLVVELRREGPDKQRVKGLAELFFPLFRRQSAELDEVIVGIDARFDTPNPEPSRSD